MFMLDVAVLHAHYMSYVANDEYGKNGRLQDANRFPSPGQPSLVETCSLGKEQLPSKIQYKVMLLFLVPP